MLNVIVDTVFQPCTGEGGCSSETDITWGIYWPAARNNTTAIASCSGSNAFGKLNYTLNSCVCLV